MSADEVKASPPTAESIATYCRAIALGVREVEPKMSEDILDRARAALEGITDAPWTHHTAPSEGSTETHAEYLAGSLIGEGEALHVLTAASPDPKFAYVVPAVTGDGPTSNRNAEFIAAARDLVPELVAEVERLRRGGTELGNIIRRQNQDVLDITGLHHLIGEDGDGDWAAVWENLAAGYRRA